MTDISTNTSVKLNALADLNLLLGRKLDRQAEAIDRLVAHSAEQSRKLELMIEHGRQTDARLDRLIEALGRR